MLDLWEKLCYNYRRNESLGGKMMAIRGAIFDMDGTLTDSMHVWKTIGSEYIKSLGKTPLEDLDRKFTSMSVYEAVEFIQRDYDVPGDRDEITDAINRTVEKRYIEDVPLKQGVVDFLEYLSKKGVVMCVATASDSYLAEAALTRLGIRKYFTGIRTSRMVGVGKEKPDIFFESAKLLGTEPSETAVFEDSVVAIRTAKKAGFFTAAVYDDSFSYAWDEIKDISDMHAEKISDYINII